MNDFSDDDLLLAVPTPDELGVKFRIEANGDLWVSYEPSGFPVQLESQYLGYIMELAGFSAEDYPPDAGSVAILQEKIRLTEPIDMRLGGPEDSTIEVHLSFNQMLAGVVLHPAKGKGKNLSRAEIYEALRSAKVVQGLVDGSLDELSSPEMHERLRQTGQPICMLVAFGEVAYNGEDAWLESLLDSITDRRPQKDEQGNIDFLELGDFPHVEADQLLVRRHPPTKGKHGWTVTGKNLKSRDGKDLNLKAVDDTVKLADVDPNVLLAKVAGMPVIDDKGAHIEQVLRLEEVGIKSGHIRFDGSVHIKGNINPGMQVEVTGDVKVGGLIEAAKVKAGGSVEVNGGIIGRKQKEEKNNEATADNAYVEAGSYIKARFVQEATLVAEQEIIVARQALHSNLKAGIKVFLPGRAAVVGGVTEAKKLIDVGVSGAAANITTKLLVGNLGPLKAQLAEVNQILQLVEVQKNQLKELITKIKQQRKPITEEKKQQILLARDSLLAKEEKSYSQLESLNEQIKELQTARILVRSACFSGSQIQIADDEFAPRNDLGKVTFYLRDGSINMR